MIRYVCTAYGIGILRTGLNLSLFLSAALMVVTGLAILHLAEGTPLAILFGTVFLASAALCVVGSHVAGRRLDEDLAILHRHSVQRLTWAMRSRKRQRAHDIRMKQHRARVRAMFA